MNTAGSEHATDSLLVEVVEEITERLNRREAVILQDYLDRYPRVATELEEVYEALMLIRASECGEPDGAREPCERAEPRGTLGDYQILREIGRGGMGVVYERGRFAGTAGGAEGAPLCRDARSTPLAAIRERGRAAASARPPQHRQHLFGWRGAGGPLLRHAVHRRPHAAQVIEELTRVTAARDGHGEAAAPALSQSTQSFFRPASPHDTDPSAAELTPPPGPPLSSTSTSSREFFQAVARLGIQAAEAMDHAHKLGVVHRDIKPSNLMIDARGHLWITDFGLALRQTADQLTMSGDLLGTLRYMSPEQVTGNRRALDYHTDIYSLGVTLYELLARRPAVTSTDRHEVIHQIAERDPQPLRQVNRAIPRDLETIVQKAMTKEPQGRYATAQEMADDLKRFLADEPIRASRPSPAARCMKWCRRHRAAAATAAALWAIAVAGLAVAGWRSHLRQNALAESLAGSLAAGEAVLETGEYATAERYLADAEARLEMAGSPSGPLAAAVAEFSRRLAEKVEADARFSQFEEIRQRVHSCRYALGQRSRDRARGDCQAALDLYLPADPQEDWKSRPTYRHLSAEKQSALEEELAELLSVRARLPSSRGQRNRAACRRDRSARAGVLLPRRVDLPSGPGSSAASGRVSRGAGEKTAAGEVKARAEQLAPGSGLDHFLQGEYHARQGDGRRRWTSTGRH